jgi:hypothetical protein
MPKGKHKRLLRRKKSSHPPETQAGEDVPSSFFKPSHESGQALPESARNFFEPRFGQDFSAVRVHYGEEAAHSAESINARAYTIGKDIVFNDGQYAPEAPTGKKLLAHELTHVVQQKGDAAGTVQRDFAVKPTDPKAIGAKISPDQVKAAIDYNSMVFTDADEIALLRDVLGLDQNPAVIDAAFIKALVQYQANFDLKQDGRLEQDTAAKLADELESEGTWLGAAADKGKPGKMALSTAARRMHLRSKVMDRDDATTLHTQGFLGPADKPTGVVTVRSGFPEPEKPMYTNSIGLIYSGANADNTHWLQFLTIQMSAMSPTQHKRVFNTGALSTTGGDIPFSNDSIVFWTVDTLPDNQDKYYDPRGEYLRLPNRSIEMIDIPGAGFASVSEDFVQEFAGRPDFVHLVIGFDTYLVAEDKTILYHVRWNLTKDYDSHVAPIPGVKGVYEVVSAGPVSKLPSELKKTLDARFPGNTVP